MNYLTLEGFSHDSPLESVVFSLPNQNRTLPGKQANSESFHKSFSSYGFSMDSEQDQATKQLGVIPPPFLLVEVGTVLNVNMVTQVIKGVELGNNSLYHSTVAQGFRFTHSK